ARLGALRLGLRLALGVLRGLGVDGRAADEDLARLADGGAHGALVEAAARRLDAATVVARLELRAGLEELELVLDDGPRRPLDARQHAAAADNSACRPPARRGRVHRDG